MFTIFASLAAATAISVSVPEDSSGHEKNSQAQASGAKLLYICQRDAASKRAFKRIHGEVKFVTAKSLLSKRDNGGQWAAPRCITGAELRRLEASSSDLIQITHQAR